MEHQGYTTFKAEAYGTINKALDPDEIGEYVDTQAGRIAKFPAESIDKPIEEDLKVEAYWHYQATSKTPAIKRFAIADEKGQEHDIRNQRNWNDLVIDVQEIN